MAAAISTKPRLERWTKGRIVFHLSSGDRMACDGRIRLHIDRVTNRAIDYDVEADDLVLAPSIASVTGITVR